MIASDLKQFAKIMTVLGELYSKSISETLLELYWRVLKQHSIEIVKKAVYSYINHEHEGSFMPKPADILRHINHNSKENALNAWSKVESAIRHVGRYSSIAFDDPIIHSVIHKMGGWSTMCSFNISQMSKVSSEFVKHYTNIYGANGESLLNMSTDWSVIASN